MIGRRLPQYRAVRADLVRGQNRFAVVDEDGAPLAIGGWKKCRRTAALFNGMTPDAVIAYLAWQGDDAQAYRASMVAITLRYPTVCAACGQAMQAGQRALWHPDEGTTLHRRLPCTDARNEP